MPLKVTMVCKQVCKQIKGWQCADHNPMQGESSMGGLFKQQITIYVNEKRQRVKKGTPGSRKVKQKSSKWYGQYVDASGKRQRVPLSTDKVAARQMLAALERKAELIRSKVLTLAEAAVSEHQDKSLEEHFNAYLTSLEAKSTCTEHRSERSRQLRRIARECGFQRLSDFERTKLEKWLTQQIHGGMSARTRNSYLTSALAFCNWCIEP